jgi:hypothetical protein
LQELSFKCFNQVSFDAHNTIQHHLAVTKPETQLMGGKDYQLEARTHLPGEAPVPLNHAISFASYILTVIIALFGSNVERKLWAGMMPYMVD